MCVKMVLIAEDSGNSCHVSFVLGSHVSLRVCVGTRHGMHTAVVKWIRHWLILLYYTYNTAFCRPNNQFNIKTIVTLPALQSVCAPVVECRNVRQFYLVVCELFHCSLINQLTNSQKRQVGVQDCPKRDKSTCCALIGRGNGCLKLLMGVIFCPHACPFKAHSLAHCNQHQYTYASPTQNVQPQKYQSDSLYSTLSRAQVGGVRLVS